MSQSEAGSFLPANWRERSLQPAVGGRIFARPVRVLTAAVFLGVLAIYLYTLSYQYSPDTMAFAVLSTGGAATAPTFFQAEHLLYPYVGRLWYGVWLFFGYRYGALVPLQILSAVFGALGVAAFFLTCRVVLAGARRSSFVSVAAALLLASSNGYWYHSTEGEDQIASTALLIVAFLCALVWRRTLTSSPTVSISAADRRRPHLGWLLGAAVTAAFAILWHATAVLALPALVYVAWGSGVGG
ncbi:MAG: DUF2723 domain-containing protein, partial [Chloroflexi bacterium]|nr:DUF2723 domain-containing protein [Chloroflexota bacterium]